MRPPHSRQIQQRYGQLFIIAISLLALGVLVTQVGSFRQAIPVLRHANTVWLGGGLLAVLLSYGLAAATYQFLAVKPLRYGWTLLVQLGSMFTNRLLPAGIGALGINFAYLRKHGHSAPAASGVVALNNLLGLTGHALLLAAVLLAQGPPKVTTGPISHSQARLVLVLLAVAVVAVAVLGRRRRLAARFLRRTARYIAGYRRRPVNLALALLTSALVTSCYAAVLYATARASGIQLTAAETFIILSLGVAGGAVVPTPGGVGGAEASLVGGLVVYGVRPAPALAAAVLYRLITYWLPFLFGIGAFAAARRRRVI